MKCIVKIANQARISEKTKRVAMKIMSDLVEMEISAGKLPMGLAATVLYMSCLKNGENKTQRDIANASGVTEVTIRNRLKDLQTRLQLNDSENRDS
jgi:transcription initiation factor TFIIB